MDRRHRHANRGFAADVTLEPQRRLPGLVRREEHAGGVSPHLAGQLHRVIGIDDRAGVNHADRRLERVDPLEKERPLLGIEDRKPLIERQHELVGFDLREIRIGGERRIQRRREAEIHRDAGLCFRGLVGRTIGTRRAGPCGDRGRHDLERPAFADVDQPVQATGLVEQARSIAFERHPRHLFVPIATDEALNVQAPRGGSPASIAQRGKGNGGLDGIAVGVDRALRIDHEVHGEVGLATSFGVDAVGLNPVRVEEDVIGAASILKRIEVDADAVVIANRVAPWHRRADAAGAIGRTKREIECPSVVADQELGRFRRRDVVAGLDLTEIVHAHRMPPDRLVQPAVDDRCGVEPRRGDRSRRGVARLRQRRRCPRDAGASDGEVMKSPHGLHYADRVLAVTAVVV